MTTSDPARCAPFRARLADFADGLLDPPDAAAVDAHVATCHACSAALSRATSLAASIAAPWDVAEPPADLAMRAQAAASARSAPRHAMPVVRSGGWASVALRYGLAFAAGVVVALAVTRTRAEPLGSPPALVGPAPVASPADADAASDALAFSSPRRIH